MRIQQLRAWIVTKRKITKNPTYWGKTENIFDSTVLYYTYRFFTFKKKKNNKSKETNILFSIFQLLHIISLPHNTMWKIAVLVFGNKKKTIDMRVNPDYIQLEISIEGNSAFSAITKSIKTIYQNVFFFLIKT